jgi:glycosyltransferase involved in cell wall biosynthesis
MGFFTICRCNGPSYSENFLILEALAVGVPVITTRETPWEI